eukprot:m.230792 g.230792  ORF g.230792 m.230792 type:complete len:686 (-) comp18860_c1_seq4:541-2598(-)
MALLRLVLCSASSRSTPWKFLDHSFRRSLSWPWILPSGKRSRRSFLLGYHPPSMAPLCLCFLNENECALVRCGVTVGPRQRRRSLRLVHAGATSRLTGSLLHALSSCSRARPTCLEPPWTTTSSVRTVAAPHRQPLLQAAAHSPASLPVPLQASSSSWSPFCSSAAASSGTARCAPASLSIRPRPCSPIRCTLMSHTCVRMARRIPNRFLTTTVQMPMACMLSLPVMIMTQPCRVYRITRCPVPVWMVMKATRKSAFLASLVMCTRSLERLALAQAGTSSRSSAMQRTQNQAGFMIWLEPRALMLFLWSWRMPTTPQPHPRPLVPSMITQAVVRLAALNHATSWPRPSIGSPLLFTILPKTRLETTALRSQRMFLRQRSLLPMEAKACTTWPTAKKAVSQNTFLRRATRLPMAAKACTTWLTAKKAATLRSTSTCWHRAARPTTNPRQQPMRVRRRQVQAAERPSMSWGTPSLALALMIPSTRRTTSPRRKAVPRLLGLCTHSATRLAQRHLVLKRRRTTWRPRVACPPRLRRRLVALIPTCTRLAMRMTSVMSRPCVPVTLTVTWISCACRVPKPRSGSRVRLAAPTACAKRMAAAPCLCRQARAEWCITCCKKRPAALPWMASPSTPRPRACQPPSRRLPPIRRASSKSSSPSNLAKPHPSKTAEEVYACARVGWCSHTDLVF